MLHPPHLFLFFFFNDTATTEIYTLSLHDALPIYAPSPPEPWDVREPGIAQDAEKGILDRSEEHTSELQSQSNLVCRLLLEKKKKKRNKPNNLLSSTYTGACTEAMSAMLSTS